MKEKIETTEAKAKEIRPMVEKLVTKGKKQNLAALRNLISLVPKRSAEKLYYELSPRYAGKNGGYTRIIKTAEARKNDAAKKAVIEFV